LARAIPWDIYEEHFDEAGWLWGVWEESLDSAVYAIEDVAVGPEERLLAHLDGLVLGGRRVAEKLLLPMLSGDDVGKVAAAAWALVQAEDADHQDAVIGALATAEPPVSAAIARALALSPRADLSRLVPLWNSGNATVRAIVLDVFGPREPDWLRDRIDPALRSGEPALIAAGLRTIRTSADRAFLDHVQDALQSGDPEVRREGILAGIALGSKAAWATCRRAAGEDGPVSRLALGLLAISADLEDRALVRQRVGDPASRRHALWALGFAGDLESAELLVTAMVDEKAAQVAGEAFSAITGLFIGGALATPGETKGPDVPEVADDDPPPEVLPEDFLPVPAPKKVKAWWEKERSRFQSGARYVYGQPRTGETVRAALATTATWRRRVMWIELATALRRSPPVDLKGWARDQRRQMDPR
jgi:uncharacterized protein (TIGR02270 family)